MVPKTRSKTAQTGPSSVPAPKKPTRTAKPLSKPSKPDPSKTKSGPTKVTKRPAKKRFRNVPQGAGGTFALRFPTVIGTTACNTCLGLYVPLTTNKCFVAQFNIEPQPDDGGDREQELDNYEVEAACYRAVEMRKGLRMVCPHAGLADTTHVGDAVAEGVTEFFGMTQRRRGEEELVPRSVENMLVRYTQGKAPQVIFPSAEELRNEWTARDEAENGIFETAGLFDDGRVKKGGDDRNEPETEGPFKARGTR
ncbi:hypothetical protein PSPO01_06226 [Paraphaeosphaeria sporulosa]